MPSLKSSKRNIFKRPCERLPSWGTQPDIPQPIDKEARARFFANVNAIAGIEPPSKKPDNP